MARCEKCLMDPCLCGTPGFGINDEEETTEKDIKELINRRVIVKVLPECRELIKKSLLSNDTYTIGSTDLAAQKLVYDSIDQRLTDVTGRIDKIGLAKPSKDGIPFPVFLIFYDNPISEENSCHWYMDEELIYI